MTPWSTVPFWSIAQRRERSGHPDKELLSVYRDWGVVKRAGRDDNFNRASEDLSNYKLVTPGDLVLNKMKTWQGSLGVSEYEGIVSPAYFVCEVSPDIHGRFLHHLLRSRRYIAHYEAGSKGIRPNQWDLPYDVLRQIPILRPPLDEQRRIADFIDNCVSRVDRIIAARRRQTQLLEETLPNLIARELIARSAGTPQSVETGWEGCQLPEGWRASTLGRVLRQLTNGYVGPTRDILVDDGVRYIQSVHIKNGMIDFDRRPFYVSEEWHEARRRINLRAGDVLIVQTGAVGQVALVPEGFGEASCHALLIARADSSLISPEYLATFLQCNFGKQAMLARATGALHPHLEAGVRSTPLLLPPRSVQDQIVDRVREDQQVIRAGIRDLERSIALLAEYKSSLISAAVTGQLDVTTAGSTIPE